MDIILVKIAILSFIISDIIACTVFPEMTSELDSFVICYLLKALMIVVTFIVIYGIAEFLGI